MRQTIQKWFSSRSLTQQVLSLIVLMLIFLLIFFFFFLSDSISSAISSQIYDMLAARQQPIVEALEQGYSPETDENLFQLMTSDSYMNTGVVASEDKRILFDDTGNPDPDFEAYLSEKAAGLLADSAQRQLEGKIDFHGMTMYYRIEKVVSGKQATAVFSYMDNKYADSLRNSLMDSTIYITVLAFFLILIVFVFWVFSIIHPLNQIKNYISAIKEGKDVDLYINREDEIGEVAQELKTLTAELAKQEKAKEEMIHNISHDLKTPIATIKSYSESIKDGIYPYGDLESSVDVILDNAQRLEDKVHSLLYMNRVEYLVSSNAQGVVTNMKDVVEQVVLNAAVIRPEIEIRTDVEEVFFDGLFESWRVCTENIMENAFRYAKSYIKIEVRENEMIISNDGPKMDESRIESLFKPYIKGEGGKFGLGLSIVSKVVAANRYKVEGKNTEDGVCFRIYKDVPKSRNSRFKNGMRNPIIPGAHWNPVKKNSRNQEENSKADKSKTNGSEDFGNTVKKQKPASEKEEKE
jgi:two-component system sensor histidine kinase CssS